MRQSGGHFEFDIFFGLTRQTAAALAPLEMTLKLQNV